MRKLSRGLKIRLAIYASCVGMFFVGAAYCTWMPGTSQAFVADPPSLEQMNLKAQLSSDVQALVALGPRNLDSPRSLRAASEYLERRLAEASGQTVRRERVKTPYGDAWNLFVDLPAVGSGRERIIVGAHYDTAPQTPGANDNGTGVAATLALAERFRLQPNVGPLRLVLFANEEPPHFQTEMMGSLVHARGCRERGETIGAMLSLESLGYYSTAANSQRYPFPVGLFYPSVGDFVAFVGDLKNRELVTRTLSTFRGAVAFPSEGGAFPSALPGIGWSDHWSFWQVGYPALMITDTAPFRDKNYHRESDGVEHLDFLRLLMVTEGIEAVIRELSAA